MESSAWGETASDWRKRESIAPADDRRSLGRSIMIGPGDSSPYPRRAMGDRPHGDTAAGDDSDETDSDMRPVLRLLLVVAACGLPGSAGSPLTAQELLVPSVDVGEAEAIAAAVQGEYSGRVRDWRGVTGRFGLRLIARGPDRFEGRLFRGGLPFDGWDRRPTIAVSGTLIGRRVDLHDEAGEKLGEIDATRAPFAWLTDEQGIRRGGLMRIERTSPTLGKAAPDGAQVLFRDGRIDGLQNARLTPSGNLAIGCMTSEPVGDFELHLEFRLPFEPSEEGQGRGNSGVYIQRRYEVQILDSFDLPPGIDRCAALYRQLPPAVNASLPPLQWQTYDIRFRAARWNAAGEKSEPARITVIHNGIVVHDDIAIASKTGAGQPEGPEPLPILLQDHRNPVEFRNVWIVRLD